MFIGDETNSLKININTASQTELMELNGVGESTAKKIINYRKTTPFNEIEDIMEVPGIGESKFANIKDKICV
ncbi:MAG: ComEA family DNA-binding protein [Clostridia bacterium]